MGLELDVQYVTECTALPLESQLLHWSLAVLGDTEAVLSLRIVDEAESAELNQRYRHKHGPTNVLSFPFENPPGVVTGILGDIVICAPVVRREAKEQGKPEVAHWAHMLVHGIMHLQGFDHIHQEDAERMETAETQILTALGFADPYV